MIAWNYAVCRGVKNYNLERLYANVNAKCGFAACVECGEDGKSRYLSSAEMIRWIIICERKIK